MTMPNFTPWSSTFDNLAWFRLADDVLSDHAAEIAVTTDDDDDRQFQVDLVLLYALRNELFHRTPAQIASMPPSFIEAQTRDAVGINLDNPWPVDTVGAALAAWKAHL